MSPRRAATGGITRLHTMIEEYYTRKVVKHGPTPKGVDWTCVAVQELRFVQLLKICDFTSPLSLNDLGCGYGALVAYLSKRHSRAEIDYLGIDLSPAMIAHASDLWSDRARTSFIVANASPRIADYSIASGVFNVRLNRSVALWERLIARTIADMHATSRKGFSMNFLAPETPDRYSAPILYRARPTRWMLYCERDLRCSVTLLEGYGLREFTLLANRTYSNQEPCSLEPVRAPRAT
jgi:SAM-dependent methyltransferase